MKQLAFLIVGSFFFGGCAGSPPVNPGVTNGRLAPCPGKPNCVSSQSPDADHRVPPLSYEGLKDDALQRLKRVIASMPRTRVVQETPDYLRAEFTSRIMRFVDDVEFYFPDEPVIHVRSASRIGYSDLGANRKRIDAIRSRFRATGAATPTGEKPSTD